MAEEIMHYHEDVLRPVDIALSHLSKIEVNKVQLIEMKQGKELALVPAFDHTVENELYRAYGDDGFIGIVKRTAHTIKVEKNIFI